MSLKPRFPTTNWTKGKLTYQTHEVDLYIYTSNVVPNAFRISILSNKFNNWYWVHYKNIPEYQINVPKIYAIAYLKYKLLYP